MIIKNSLRQQYALLACSYSHIKPSISKLSKIQINRCYTVPTLPHHNHFLLHGVPDALSKEGFHQAWITYQNLLVSELNRMTAGEPDQEIPLLQLVFKNARESSKAALFNYASMAHNDALFFSSLCPRTTNIPDKLAEHITGSFSSIDAFRETFIATATAMFGPGFVWLVKRNSGPALEFQNLAILTTYIAGSPYAKAHFRKQNKDMNTQTTNTSSNMLGTQNVGAVGNFGPFSAHSLNLTPGGVELEVLLGVSTWQHVWVLDHGIDGKRRYLEAVWSKIDWGVVNERAKWNNTPPQSKYARPYR